MKGIGLVLAGGGGKGSFQIGVWKYLHTYGIDRYIRVLSGTSVGALNAALFASGSYEKAEELWLNIRPEQILSPRKYSAQDIVCWIAKTGWLSALSAIPGVAEAQLAATLPAIIGRPYAFSRDGLLELMEKGIDFSALKGYEYTCAATCLSLPLCSKDRFDLRDYDISTIKNILLASSAIPLVFDSVEINGTRYCDGGVPMVGDNIPIEPVYETGIENILVIHLSRDTLIDRSQYPNAHIIEIIPENDLGDSINGTLDFSPEGSKRRIEQGYRDAEKVFGSSVQMTVYGKLQEKILQAFRQSEYKFQIEKTKIEAQRETILDERKKDGFDSLCKKLGI